MNPFVGSPYFETFQPWFKYVLQTQFILTQQKEGNERLRRMTHPRVICDKQEMKKINSNLSISHPFLTVRALQLTGACKCLTKPTQFFRYSFCHKYIEQAMKNKCKHQYVPLEEKSMGLTFSKNHTYSN